jgi:opine dehydrogenase
VLPQIHFKNDIIYNGLENMNALVHPGPVLMNIGRIESGATFEYYTDMTPSQCKLIEVLDKERIALGTACGFDIPDFVASFKELYPETYGNTVYEVLTNNPSYKGIKAPTTIRNRYLYEDVPYSLQAFQSLGKILGVTTPCIDSLITLARYMIPSLKDGSTLDNLGLTGITKEEFLKICREQK